ncbi:hypothetical protein [Plantactinospora sp. WMMB782]|uniref:hypothetical protein n=1 Tax=Plantactinospora sp. WMMB782 TaxID=3404121 RepID=UPI003B928237
MSGELVYVGEVIDGELVDECACGNPGQLMADPFDADVNNGDAEIVLCGDCANDLFLDI